MPSCVAAPAAGGVDWQEGLPANVDGGQVSHRPHQNPILHDRSKHIKFHFLRDCINGGQVVIEFVETSM
jgi:hypothetical protein